MQTIGRRVASWAIVVALPLSAFGIVAILLAAAPGSRATATPLLSSEPLQGPSFVGPQRCRVCHQDISIDFQSNPHVDTPLEVDGTDQTGCETCHGGGADHARSMNPDLIRRFNTGNPVSDSDACLGCHSSEATHPDRFLDIHGSASVTCTSCHSIHNSQSQTPLLRSTPNALCTDCHSTAQAQFQQPFAHSIRNDAVECVDCHTPHGSTGNFLAVRVNANEAACLGCHGDKRGPFTYEHMPAAVGGCTTCHAPHGSPNPRMLVRHQVQLLCLECHTDSSDAFGRTPPAFHDLRSMRFENCTLCHTRIHGSHLSPALLR